KQGRVTGLLRGESAPVQRMFGRCTHGTSIKIIRLQEADDMENILFIQTGTGVDLHGQDVNVAAQRAVSDAIHYNSMPGVRNMLPDGDINRMHVRVKLAVP